jgi:predicted RNA-binding protein YlxR (DUF448 family)
MCQDEGRGFYVQWRIVMIKGTMLQRLIAPHLTSPIDIPEEIKKNIKEYRDKEKDERDRSRHVQREGGQSR